MPTRPCTFVTCLSCKKKIQTCLNSGASRRNGSYVTPEDCYCTTAWPPSLFGERTRVRSKPSLISGTNERNRSYATPKIIIVLTARPFAFGLEGAEGEVPYKCATQRMLKTVPAVGPIKSLTMEKHLFKFSTAILLAWSVLCATVAAQTISLGGTWKFKIDRDDKGVTEKWFDKSLPETIQLPGTMAENRKGDDVTLQTRWTGSIYDSSYFFRASLAKYRQPGNIKIPFWLTPLKHYVGVAWYQKEVTVPADWNNRRIMLFLERCHIQTRVWVDDREAGYGNSLVVAHEFDLTKALTPGKHTLTLRMDNSIKEVNVGPDSHSVTDHTQGNWNGIVGKMLLKAGSPVYLDDLQVYPDIKNKQVKVMARIVNSRQNKASGEILISAKSFNSKVDHTVTNIFQPFNVSSGDTARIQMVLPLGSKMQLWDEFNPALYMLTATVTTSDGSKDEKQVQFGMREVGVSGTRIEINGIPVFLRGTVNNCEFPLTGYPPTDVASWERLFKIARAHGLNHMRFHSWCPPEAAFIAADKTGFYLQPEGPTWPNHGTSLGDGRFIDKFLYDETNRMVKAYGNHPSFCMLSGGNEPAGRNQAKYLGEFVKYWQAKDKRRLYTGASVAMSWPLYPESDYMIKSGPRGLNWNNTRPETISDYHAAIEKFTMPYITHEMGQWCVFPNFKEIEKYTGVYRARNFEMFREDLKDHGMSVQAEDFLNASGKLQALCYKQEIEKSLRTPGLAGFQLLGLQDFPGQGTALVGVLDAFWDEKGYITAKEWNRFCNSTVPLTRISKFVYASNETFTADVELFHFERAPLQNALIKWTIKNEKGAVIRSGNFSPQTYPVGNCIKVGTVNLPLSEITTATKLNLEVTVANTSFANDWDFWVYPAKLSMVNSGEIHYTDTLDAKAEEILNRGGKVFLNAAGKVVKGKEVVQYFTPVFWNTSWFKMRPPHTLGFVVQAKHPAFADFSTEYHSDLQWWEIANRAQVMNLEDFPKGFKPLVQPIDTWFMNRRLAMVLEVRVGNGKLLVSSADLVSDTANRIAARQLFYSIQQYMLSDKFNPEYAVDVAVIKDLFISPSREQWDSFTKDSPDELKPKK